MLSLFYEPIQMNDERLMKEAYRLALEAYADGDVPVGCIVSDENGKIIGCGRNRRDSGHDATAHAEIEAIREACRLKNDFRLNGCSLYVTLEPCPMCTGAIINSRIDNVYFAARSPESGSCGSVIDLFQENYGHNPKVFYGILEPECSELLRSFFSNLRN